MKKTLKQTVLIILLFIFWLVLSETGTANSFLVPSPFKVFKSGLVLIENGKLLTHIGISFLRVLYGFSLTVLVAVPLSFIFYFIPGLYTFFKGFFSFIKSIPPLATVPLLILWFGIGEGSKLAIIFLASFFPIFLDTFSGLSQVDLKILEMGDTLELTYREKIFHILIPEALPTIITGLRLGFAYCWRALIGAEMIAASSGLGYMILDAEEMARTDIVYLGIIMIGILGLIIEFAALKTVEKLFPWMISMNRSK